MENAILAALLATLRPSILGATLAGVVVGFAVGFLPGLQANLGIALLLPVTFGMNPAAGLAMLCALYTAAIYAGSIPAILVRTPGTSASAATAIDGYELTQQGRAVTALRTSAVASVMGGLLSGIALLLLAPPLSRLSLRFGPPEYFLLAIFGLTAVAGVASDSLLKGLIAAAVGLLLGTVGMETSSGFARFTFHIPDLQSGISFVPVMIGLFGLSEVLAMSTRTVEKKRQVTRIVERWRWIPTRQEMAQLKGAILRSSLIGIFIGILPGAGADIASWVAYTVGRRFSRSPGRWGKGSEEAVACSESANNAVTGGSLIPLLTLGIPGSASAAVLLGGLMIHGLAPGRELFTRYAEMTYTAIFAFLIANLVMGAVGMLAARYLVRVTLLPRSVVAPVVAVLCVVGSYSLSNNLFDVWVMTVSGIAGYFMRVYGYSAAALALGLILGPMAERSFRQALTLARGALVPYVLSRPLSLILIGLIVAFLVVPVLLQARKEASGDVAVPSAPGDPR